MENLNGVRNGSAIISRHFGDLVDLYWLALASFQNVIEDIAGADGRLEYLLSLRCRLVEVGHEMDDLLSGTHDDAHNGHHLALALECGLPHFGLAASDVIQQLGFDLGGLEYDHLQSRLLAFGAALLEKLPGEIPAAQGPQGQGQTLRAMRNWSAAAAKVDIDLGFLAERLQQL